MKTQPANIWSIPAGAPFLKTLARAVLQGGFPSPDLPAPGPSELPRYTILVPTRRAARELATAFLNVAEGAALLLPRIQPLGDVDEEELALTQAAFDTDATADVPAAISPLRRQLLLARMLLEWAENNPEKEFSKALKAHSSQAVEIAADLGRLVDQLETEEVDLNRLPHLVTEDFAAYWLDVLDVLNLVRQRLPDELSSRGLVGASERRSRLLHAEAARLSALNPEAPYIAAGSTGSIPATAKLLEAISRLPNGAVVLPGLDTALDEDSWQCLDPQHPQFGLYELLENLGARREDVELMGEVTETSQARAHLLSETMRPSETTDLWQSSLPKLQPQLDAALNNLTLVRAPGRREEALSIALTLRRAVDTPGRTAALITPDRNLGRRVSAHLKRWNLNVDDSAGVPLSRTPPGTFVDLLLSALESNFSPARLVNLCAHPLARFGMLPGEAAQAARKMELAVLRGVAPNSLQDIPDAIEHRRTQVTNTPHWFPHLAQWGDTDWAAALRAAHMVPPPFAPLMNMCAAGFPVKMSVAVETIVRAAEAIASDAAGDSSNLWSGEAGEQLSQFFANLLEAADDGPLIATTDLRQVIMALLSQAVVRPRYGTHPRLQILGLLEARMTDHDVVVLGGLNEKIWPTQTQSDVWLNRPMRADLGLPSPERRMGLSAHDFVQAACASGPVYLTFSEKQDGAPAVPSRWLLRLAAILEALEGPDLEAAGRDLMASTLGLDHVEMSAPVARPSPAPALSLRPKRLRITEVETWLRDPYAIYARHILNLEPLEELGLAPGPRERGTLFHEIFERFSVEWAAGLPTDIAGELERIGMEHFSQWASYPDVAAFWWPRFLRIAEAAAEHEERLREGTQKILVEVPGKLSIPLGQTGLFTLTGRADRIDILEDGSARLIDYKTGAPPGITEALTGKAPQLLLEAIMVSEGAFDGVPPLTPSQLLYLQVSGGEPAIAPRLLDPARAKPKMDASIEQIARAVYARLQKHIIRFNSDPNCPYLPRILPKYENADMAYDHLSRYREWSGFANQGEDGS